MRRELADQGLHPNAAGYEVIAPLAARAIVMDERLRHSRPSMTMAG
jgi:lysophospholipase L1-like esterase